MEVPFWFTAGEKCGLGGGRCQSWEGEVIDRERVRAETPGCGEVIHFNHAGASLMPDPVRRVVLDHLNREALTGPYEAKEEAEEELVGVYGSVARFIGAKPAEIAVVENATRAFDMAFHAIPFRPGDVVLTSTSEYASNYLAYLRVREERGVEIQVVPDDGEGQISVEALEAHLNGRARLISLAHVPTNSGLVQPAATIGALARRAGAWYLLDATQSAGQIPLDVEKLGCHILCATARKYLRGPRGVGFLYVCREILDGLVPPFIDLHAATWTSEREYRLRPDARRFENWESNIASTLGLGAAVEYAEALGIEEIWAAVRERAARLREALMHVEGVRMHDRGRTLCGIVSLTVAGVTCEAVKRELRAQRINVSVSDASSTLLDMRRKGLDAVVRASAHYLTTEEEIDTLCDAVRRLVRRSAGPS